MKFTKMQGLGNDYIYINCFEEKVSNPVKLAFKLSNRNFGIGSDGLILIGPSEVADFKMSMYNADGSIGEMCGNGIRCVGKYVYDFGLTDQTTLDIETLAGVKHLELIVQEGKVTKVRVDMGSPILEPKDIPINLPGSRVVNEPIRISSQVFHFTGVSMGNPHAVVFIEKSDFFFDTLKDLNIESIGPGFENHPLFPNRINTEFVNVIDEQTVEMRVWERGSGETMACGTGACAVAVACVLNGFTKNQVKVKLLGGDLEIEWDQDQNRVYMTGPATTVFTGELDDGFM